MMGKKHPRRVILIICRVASLLIVLRSAASIFMIEADIGEGVFPAVFEAALAILFFVMSFMGSSSVFLLSIVTLSFAITLVEVAETAALFLRDYSQGFSYRFTLENHWPGMLVSVLFLILFIVNARAGLKNWGARSTR